MPKNTPLLPLEQHLYTLLDRAGFPYRVHEHVAVFTVEEAQQLKEVLPGAHSKNLFLKDKKKNYTLVSVLDHKQLDLKALAKNHAQGTFSFASDADLESHLGVKPGSVTPMGFIQSAPHKIRFLLDKDFQNADYVHFHPLRNDKTIRMTCGTFLAFLTHVGQTPIWIDVPEL